MKLIGLVNFNLWCGCWCESKKSTNCAKFFFCFTFYYFEKMLALGRLSEFAGEQCLPVDRFFKVLGMYSSFFVFFFSWLAFIKMPYQERIHICRSRSANFYDWQLKNVNVVQQLNTKLFWDFFSKDFLYNWGLEHLGEKDYECYKNHEDPDLKKAVHTMVCVSEGMNAWIRHPDFRPPVESWLIGATIEDFKPTDLLAISRYDVFIRTSPGDFPVGSNILSLVLQAWIEAYGLVLFQLFDCGLMSLLILQIWHKNVNTFDCCFYSFTFQVIIKNNVLFQLKSSFFCEKNSFSH